MKKKLFSRFTVSILVLTSLANPASADLTFHVLWKAQAPKTVQVSIGDDVRALVASAGQNSFDAIVSAASVFSKNETDESALNADYQDNWSVSVPLRLRNSTNKLVLWLTK